MCNARVTPSMIFYGTFAAGAVVPWYFNIKYMQESGELLTPQAWLAGGFINPLTASITTDFLIGTIPVLVWMVVEARRLGMRYGGSTSSRHSWWRLRLPVHYSCSCAKLGSARLLLASEQRFGTSIESRLIAFLYSCRRAIIGSMSEARRAGTTHASVATVARISDTAATVAMESGRKP
jgi:Protein of unknown function DUF2834